MSPRPNPDHTPARSIRISEDLWEAAKAVAAERDETVSEVVNRYLARYVKAGANRNETPLARELRRWGA